MKCHIQPDDSKKVMLLVLLLRHVHTDSNVTSFIGIDGANTGSSSQTLNIFALASLICVLIMAVKVNTLITC